MKAKPLHDCVPGELAHAAGFPLARALQQNEVRVNSELYDDSGDDVHLWRAWRAARVMGDITPECMALLAPRLDALSARKINPKRANQRAQRNAMLVLYYDLLTRKQLSKNEAERRVARKYATTPKTVEQLVIRHESEIRKTAEGD